MMTAMGDLGAHVTTGAMLVYGLEYLKRVGWCPWLRAETRLLNRLVSVGYALIVSVGITVTGDAGSGWVWYIPPLSTLLIGIFEAAKQFTAQELIWDGVVAPKRVRFQLANGGGTV